MTDFSRQSNTFAFTQSIREERKNPSASVADELEKLGDLENLGALVEKKLISPQEFPIPKEKHLAAKT